MKAACWPGACPASRQSVPWGRRKAGIRAPGGPWASGHLQPQLTQRLTLGLQLATMQQLLLQVNCTTSDCQNIYRWSQGSVHSYQVRAERVHQLERETLKLSIGSRHPKTLATTPPFSRITFSVHDFSGNRSPCEPPCASSAPAHLGPGSSWEILRNICLLETAKSPVTA